MVPIVVAGLLGVGVAGVVGYGLLSMTFRRRPVQIVDFLELPAPPASGTDDSDAA